MEKIIDQKKFIKKLYIYLSLTWVCYTLTVVYLVSSDLNGIKEATRENAIIQVRTNFSKDIIYRNWATIHGGVYVPITDLTQPNPFLKVPNKNVITQEGLHLTLMNPAFMTRQVYEFMNRQNNVIGKITSLKPIRPENAPDEWEERALKQLDKEKKEVIEFVKEKGEEYIKFMGAFYTVEGCLKCHGDQGYQVGDVRGGISIRLPMTKYLKIEDDHIKSTITNFSIIWLGGIIILFISGNKIKRRWIDIFESETKFSRMISTLQDGIIIFDENNKIKLFNETARQIYGVSRQQVMGTDFTALHNEIFSDVGNSISIYQHPGLLTAKTGNHYSNVTIGFTSTDEIKKWVSVNSQALSYDEVNNKVTVLMSIRDISEKIKLENELKQYKDSLEDVVQERTDELKITNKKLENEIIKQKEAEEKVSKALKKEKELNELKTRFISTASHEFRTPLTSILTSAEILDMFGLKCNENEFSNQVHRIINSVEYLTKLMDDVLTMSSTESGKIHFMPKLMDFYQLCLDIISDVELNTTDKHNLVFEYLSEEKEYKLDEKLLRFVILNLLSNAVKYSPEGGEILFRIEVSDNTIHIIVKDNGLGIPLDDQKHLFEPFHRAINTRELPGTGLGLSIVKKSVELHKGSITFKSIENKGTTFNVRVPVINK